MAKEKLVKFEQYSDMSKRILEIIDEGKTLETREEALKAKEAEDRSIWVEKTNKKAEDYNKKFLDRIEKAKKQEKKEGLNGEKHLLYLKQLEEKKAEMERKRIEFIQKTSDNYVKQMSRNKKHSDIARIKGAMAERKAVLSQKAWSEEVKKWKQLLQSVSGSK